MDSPSTKRAYAATLAASLGVANQEVPWGDGLWKVVKQQWAKNLLLKDSIKQQLGKQQCQTKVGKQQWGVSINLHYQLFKRCWGEMVCGWCLSEWTMGNWYDWGLIFVLWGMVVVMLDDVGGVVVIVLVIVLVICIALVVPVVLVVSKFHGNQTTAAWEFPPNVFFYVRQFSQNSRKIQVQKWYERFEAICRLCRDQCFWLVRRGGELRDWDLIFAKGLLECLKMKTCFMRNWFQNVQIDTHNDLVSHITMGAATIQTNNSTKKALSRSVNSQLRCRLDFLLEVYVSSTEKLVSICF